LKENADGSLTHSCPDKCPSLSRCTYAAGHPEEKQRRMSKRMTKIEESKKRKLIKKEACEKEWDEKHQKQEQEPQKQQLI